MRKLDFVGYLLTENRSQLGQRVGDVLNGLQDLQQNGKAMGTRQQINNAETIVNQIRRILHTNWNKENEKYLPNLQKVGVAIMKAIEEKDDLMGIVAGSTSEVQELLDKLGVPVNSLATPDQLQSQGGDQESLAPPQGKKDQQQAPPNQAGEMPAPGGASPMMAGPAAAPPAGGQPPMGQAPPAMPV